MYCTSTSFVVQIGHKHQPDAEKTALTMDKALALVKDVFIAAAERDIYTGDGLTIKVITGEGIKTESFPLRRD